MVLDTSAPGAGSGGGARTGDPTASGSGSEPIVRHEFVTARCDEADRFVRDIYAEHDSEVANGGEGFRFEAGYVRNSTFGIEYLSVSGVGRIRLQPLRCLMIVNVTSGRVEIRAGAVSREDVWPGEFVVVGPNVELDVRWDEVKVSIIRLELAAAEALVATLEGTQRIDPDLGIARPVGEMQASHLRSTIEHLRRDVLPNAAAARSGLVRRQAFSSLAAALMNTFPTVLVPSDPLTTTAAQTVSAIVRRACAYMAAHAQERVSMGEVSRAAYVSPRTLQDAFRKHLAITPTEYLTRIRLRGAHDDLQRMDKARGDTVAQVARRWRFANGGRFAKLYRDQYGMTPHQTLEM